MITTQSGLEKPVALGGKPSAHCPLHIVRPVFPDLATIAEPLAAMLRSGQLTNHARYVPELEARLQSTLRVPHAITVCNGTLGLLLTLAGLHLTGEVIVPSFTFAATAHVLQWAGLRPRFADICPATFNLDPAAVEAAITPATSAILAVHVYGHPCDIDALQQIADRHQLALIFDAAHAFGASYRGQPIGSFGRAEVFSFHATKLFPAGEGGAITTTDATLANYLELARKFGIPGGEESLFPGINAKLQEFNALLALENLESVPQVIANRRAYVTQIQERLARLPGLQFQQVQPDVSVTHQNLAVVVDADLFGLTRDQLYDNLMLENIFPRKYFYPPLHQHTAYATADSAAAPCLPVTERVAASVLCLPLYSQMSEEEIDCLCGAIEKLHHWAGRIRTAP